MAFTKLSELLEEYRLFLDSDGAVVNIAGIEFTPSQILENLDPVAFRCGYLDFANSDGIDLDSLEDDLND